MVTNKNSVDSTHIGSRIMLISTNSIRYEGTLSTIDTNDGTITLQHVRSFGTEGRRRDGTEVPPTNGTQEYRIFEGADIRAHYILDHASPAVEDPGSLPASKRTTSTIASPAVEDPGLLPASIRTTSTTASAAVEHPAIISASGAVSHAENPLKLGDLLPAERQLAASQFRKSSREIFAKLKRDGFIVLDSPTAAKIKLSRAHQSLRSYRCKASFEGTFVSARHLPRRHVLEFNAGGSPAVVDQDLPPAKDS